MNRMKAWLCDKFLPAWCRDKMEMENRTLSARVSELKHENDMLRAYIDGLRDALKYGRKINIYAGGEKNGPSDGSVRASKDTKS